MQTKPVLYFNLCSYWLNTTIVCISYFLIGLLWQMVVLIDV